MGGMPLRGTDDPERPRFFACGEPRYENVEVMKTSSSVITVLMVGVRLEQAEIVVGSAFFFAFGTLAFNMSSQPDLNSKVKGRLLDEGD